MSTDHQSIKTMEDLHAVVLHLENRQRAEGEELRDWFRETYEAMRPLNLIKSVFTEVTESQDLKDHLVGTGLGLVAGHASKAVFESASDSPIKGLLGSAIQFGVTNVVARHPDLIIAVSSTVFSMARNAWRAGRADAVDTAAEDISAQSAQNPSRD
jgi:hypothetical protein